MSTVIFETELNSPAVATDVIRRHGKVFAVGDYPDKGFALTMEEAAAAVAAFEPVSANLSHHKTVADGRCGTLESVALQEDGSITGTFAEPVSFAQWLGDGARKLSLEWDKAAKRIVGVAHALNPRIPDAVVFEAVAAFERGESPEPLAEFAYESVKERDKIAPEDFGDPANKLFPCRTQQEFRQCIENLAMANDPTAVKARLLAIAEAKGFEMDLTNIIWPRSGVSVPLPMASFENKEKTMATPKKGFVAALRDVLRGATDEEIASFEANTLAAHPAQAAATKSAAEIALEEANDKIAAFEAASVAAATAERKARAIAFADGLVAEQRIVAKGNEEYKQALVLFELADNFEISRPALACFEAGFEAKDARPLDALKALFAKLPAHGKNEEAVTNVPEGAVALFERAVTVTNEAAAMPEVNTKTAEAIKARRKAEAKNK